MSRVRRQRPHSVSTKPPCAEPRWRPYNKSAMQRSHYVFYEYQCRHTVRRFCLRFMHTQEERLFKWSHAFASDSQTPRWDSSPLQNVVSWTLLPVWSRSALLMQLQDADKKRWLLIPEDAASRWQRYDPVRAVTGTPVWKWCDDAKR